MDFNLKQWRHESEHQDKQQPPSSPKLHHPSALPLFSSEPNSSNLSAPFFSHHSTTPSPPKITRGMGSYFSLSQWQELELQALIFRHMISGADVPPELLHLVKKSAINNSPYYQYFPHYQPSLLQSGGYWGRGAMDPEPGRCRRTDGKKWRCARDVVAGQKYCERHMHRGKNRSRKPVETPTTSTTTTAAAASPHFTLSSDHLLNLNPRPPGDSKGPFEAPGRTTRHFFNDWPKPIAETDNASATNLSISMPGNPSSDFSLKLGTGGNGDEASTQLGSGEREKPNSNWETMWGTNHLAAPMGGPLAEALRSSTSTSSPTSVLHRLPRGGPVSEASYVSY